MKYVFGVRQIQHHKLTFRTMKIVASVAKSAYAD
jgi:hypothetical protein